MKTLITIVMFFSFVSADIYEANCVSCHKDHPVTLERLFYRYLLTYSSEKAVKEALFDYIKEPDYYKSVMSEGYINRFGIKLPSTLKDQELQKAIDVYWQKFQVFGKLQ